MKPWTIMSALGLTGLLGALAVPLINITESPIPIKPELMTGKAPSFQAASAIFQTSCLDCHSAKARIPWYASMPIARDMIGADIKRGQLFFNMTDALYQANTAPTANTLAKIEHQLDTHHMPPLRYVALHWKGAMSDEKKATINTWIRDERRRFSENSTAADAFKLEPIQPLQPIEGLNPQKVALGKQLFHETRLSGDNTLSCASCHALSKGGTDQAVSSTGIRGQKGPINSPTVYNAVLHSHQFWDGRAADLAEQALGPVTNPIEMGGDWATILPILNKDKTYGPVFRSIYQGPATTERVTDAIATFESTLITTHSPFDNYLQGDLTAITDHQKQGYQVFKSMGCVSCHSGPAIGGQGFEKMGAYHNYIDDRGHKTKVDLGRFNVTQNPDDQYRFKVPSLRNITLTFPYFHDGQVNTLEDAVSQMAYYQLDHKLSVADRDAIVDFLGTLTGEINGESIASPKSTNISKKTKTTH